MNTIADPGSRTGNAAAATRKCALALTANVSSHWAAVVPAIPRPSPIPTFSTRPSSAPSAAADSATTDAHASGNVTSASTTAALCPSPRTRAAVVSAAPASRSAQATAAPSRAASTEMARPFPTGGSGSGDGRVPAPTTSSRRPVSRPRPGAVPRNSGIRPHRRGIGGQRHVERVEQERDQRVVPAQRDQLDHPGVAQEGVRGVVGGTVDPAMNTELAGHRIHGSLVVRLERRILAAPDRVDHRLAHAVLARHRRVREPLELGLPPAPDGDDGDLGQPPLDRGVEPQRRAEGGQPPSGARRGHERVERPGQAALGGHQQVAPSIEDGVPQLLPLGPELLPPHIRKTGHRLTIAGAPANTRFSVSTGPRYSAASLK